MHALKYLALALTLALSMSAQAQSSQIIGWVEHVHINPGDMIFKARIDTGADNSSIHAENINIYEKDGVKMVKFTIANKDGQSATLDLPLVRMTNIKRKGTDPLKRPVVRVELCLGNTLKSVYVNLANRDTFKYRMLIGRSFLKGSFAVDSEARYTVEPACKAE